MDRHNGYSESKKFNEIKKAMSKTKAVIFDLDGTLISGNVYASIGKNCIKNELLKGNLQNFSIGITNFLRVKNIIKNEKDNDLALFNGIQIFYDSIIKIGLTKNEMELYSRQYMQKHIIKNTISLATNFTGPKIISTMSSSTIAKIATEFISDSSFVSNLDIFNKKGALTNIAILIKNGDQKLEATANKLQNYKIKPKECTVVVNGYNDMALVYEAKKNGLVIASPYAINEIKKHADIILLKNEEIIKFERKYQ